ncbi:MAG: type II toxin-antitoxin system HicA family toxin [Thermoleophilaceae bacterium]
MRRRELERHLSAHGCRLDREGAKHAWWVGPKGRSAIPRHREIKPGTVRAICKQLGVREPPSVT